MKVLTTVGFTGPKCNLEARAAAKGYADLGLPVKGSFADGEFFIGGLEKDGGIPIQIDEKEITHIGDKLLHLGKNLKVCPGEDSTIEVRIVVEGEEYDGE